MIFSTKSIAFSVSGATSQIRIRPFAHTCTDYDTAMQAFEHGANHLTHGFNAMPGIHHRKPVRFLIIIILISALVFRA